MRLLLVCLCLISAGLLSCKKKGCTDPLALNYDPKAKKDDASCVYPSNTPVSAFTFRHQIAGAAFLWDTVNYLHPGGYLFSVENLNYFISDIVLYKAGGDSVYLDAVHYVDAENSTTHTYTYTGKIDNGDYTGISFIFGLDEEKNVTGAFNNPPESLMQWPVPMGGGYHYMKLEGKYDSSGVIRNYNTHTGALDGIPYHFRADLYQLFTISDNNVDAEFIMEINNWYQNPNLFDFTVFGDAIMGNATAQQKLMENGNDVFSIGSIH